jgi:1-acyl-sn-glycerol-3-phosphate acyltransferase
MSKSYSPTWRLISVIVLRPLLTLLIRNKWSGRENIPKKGGVIFAPNHLSYVDWGTDALFFQANGRYPTFLIKDGAFKVKGIGPGAARTPRSCSSRPSRHWPMAPP